MPVTLSFWILWITNDYCSHLRKVVVDKQWTLVSHHTVTQMDAADALTSPLRVWLKEMYSPLSHSGIAARCTNGKLHLRILQLRHADFCVSETSIRLSRRLVSSLSQTSKQPKLKTARWEAIWGAALLRELVPNSGRPRRGSARSVQKNCPRIPNEFHQCSSEWETNQSWNTLRLWERCTLTGRWPSHPNHPSFVHQLFRT